MFNKIEIILSCTILQDKVYSNNNIIICNKIICG